MESPEAAEFCFPKLLNASCRKPSQHQTHSLLGYVLLSFVSLLTSALNLLVIVSISHFRQLHTSTNLLLLSLAVSDFLVGFLLMPVKIVLTGACWFLGDISCILYYILDFIITSSSVGNMVLISIDRYLAICDPLRYTTRVTLAKTKICVCLCWANSVLFNCLLLKDFQRQSNAQNSCYGECVLVLNQISGTVDLFFTFVGPISVIIVLYLRVFLVAASQARAMRSQVVSVSVQQNTVGMTYKKSEMKAAMVLGMVVVVFLVCFCPFYAPSLLGQDLEENSSSSLYVVVWLLYFNSCLNPVIYALFYPWFRKSIKLIVTLKILKPDSCDTNML